MQFLLFFFMFNSLFIFAADHNKTVGSLKGLKEKLYVSFGNTESHDETISVLSSLLKHPKLSVLDRVSFKQELKLREEAMFRDREMHNFFATLADDTYVPIVKKHGEKCEAYSNAITGDLDSIDKMIVYSNLDSTFPTVSMYWWYKIKIHPNAAIQERDEATSVLKECYKLCYDWAKSLLKEPEKGKKRALFVQQWQNVQLGNPIISPHEFIRIYADDQWIEFMKREAEKLDPKVFEEAQKGGFFEMLEMVRTFEEKEMPCSAMYWLHRIESIENLDEGFKSAAQENLRAIYNKLWTQE